MWKPIGDTVSQRRHAEVIEGERFLDPSHQTAGCGLAFGHALATKRTTDGCGAFTLELPPVGRSAISHWTVSSHAKIADDAKASNGLILRG